MPHSSLLNAATGCSFPGKGSYPTSQQDELGLPDALFPGIFLGNAGSFDLIFLKAVSVLAQCLAQRHVPEEFSFLPAVRMGEKEEEISVLKNTASQLYSKSLSRQQ